MNRGEFVTFMLVPDMVKLMSEQLEVFTNVIRWPIPACHIMRSFVCKHLDSNIKSEIKLRVVFQFCNGHVLDILVDK